MENAKRSLKERIRRWVPSVLSFWALSMWAGDVQAVGGTHAFAVSTWDTTLSTVVFTHHHGFLPDGGLMRTVGYNANFTSTTGQLSAQFGLHYVGLHPGVYDRGMHGIAGSAVAVYSFPFGERFSNGRPRAAFTIFAGSVPTAVFNGEYNKVTLPLNMGLGVVVRPVRYFSVTPWVEVAPSFNLDTIIRYAEFQEYLESLTIDDLHIEYGPDGEVVNAVVRNDVVNRMIDETVSLKFSFTARIRGGLSMVLHLGDKVDLILNGTIAQVGERFTARPTFFVGGSLAFAWDDPPAAVIPEEERLKRLSCPTVEARFQSCPAYRRIMDDIRAEEREQLMEELREAREAVEGAASFAMETNTPKTSSDEPEFPAQPVAIPEAPGKPSPEHAVSPASTGIPPLSEPVQN